MELIYFVLAAYGITQILVYGDLPLLVRLRPPKSFARGYGKLFHCPMCMGFHVGWFLMLLSPFTELFNFDITVANFFILGGLSSGTSYILTMLVGDEGIKHEHKHLDTKVDAAASPTLL